MKLITALTSVELIQVEFNPIEVYLQRGTFVIRDHHGISRPNCELLIIRCTKMIIN